MKPGIKSAPPDWLRPGPDGRLTIPTSGPGLYGVVHAVRSCEEAILALFAEDAVAGTTHTCLGQELSQLAIARALDHDDDCLLSTHRNHGHVIAMTGDMPALIAEVAGRRSGLSGGLGGSQHMYSERIVTGGIQAGLTAFGVGVARAVKTGCGVVAIVMGDGSLGEGLVYESFNLASVWRVPALFVVENNGIAQSTETELTTAGDMLLRGRAFGLETLRLCDDQPDFLVRVASFVGEVRKTRRPGLLVLDTRRLGPHSKGDDTRAASVIEKIQNDDPVRRLANTIPEARRLEIEAANQVYIKDAIEWALTAPNPVELPREAKAAVPIGVRAEATSSVRSALNTVLSRILEAQPLSVLIGQDLSDPYGGAFKVTRGLSTAHPGRVLTSPISEAALVGAGIGLAWKGWTAIVEIMFADFLGLCVDPLLNLGAKLALMGHGRGLSLLVRAACGGGRGYGPTHSQSLDAVMASLPGVEVLMPTHRHDVAGVVASAAALRRPVVLLEHKLLYGQTVDPGPYVTFPGEEGADFPTIADIALDADLIVVAFGGTVLAAERAVARLRDEEELAVSLVLPCHLSGVAFERLAANLPSGARVLIIEESRAAFGIGAELAACLAVVGGFKIRRLGGPALIPASRDLEMSLLPNDETIISTALELFLADLPAVYREMRWPPR